MHVASNTVSSNSTGSVVTGHSGIHLTVGLLPTAMIPIANSSSTNSLCRALLDSGSQLIFVTEDTVQRMGLKRLKQSTTINGIGNVTKSYNSGLVIIQITTQKGVIDVTAYILPTLTQFLPSSEFSIRTNFHLRSIELADPNFNKPGRIEMILGSDVFEEVVLDGKFTAENGIHFRNTVFGWIASGKHPESQPIHSKITSSVCVNNTFDLRKFWELEEILPIKTETAEEIACEQHFQETTRVENNRFVVQMPFRADVKPLGDTYLQAKRRFLSLEKRLQSDPQLKEGYCNFIHEFAELEHIEPVPIDDIHKPNEEINFLPHHCVQKAESTTTKLRVVFDGSAKSDNGISLNSSLMVGPTIQQDLFSLLVRFRLHRVALTADIAKMYRQIVSDTSARDFHRFLWREDPNQPIQQFRMTRVIYGITSAAYHSVRALVEVSNRCSNKEIAMTIKNDFYVDDYLSGTDSLAAAKEQIRLLCQELSNFGFELRKWASSHSELISSLPEQLRESSEEAKFMD